MHEKARRSVEYTHQHTHYRDTDTRNVAKVRRTRLRQLPYRASQAMGHQQTTGTSNAKAKYIDLNPTYQGGDGGKGGVCRRILKIASPLALRGYIWRYQ